jgi:hypothetical protein
MATITPAGWTVRYNPASLGSVKSETSAARAEMIYYATHGPTMFAPMYFRV